MSLLQKSLDSKKRTPAKKSAGQGDRRQRRQRRRRRRAPRRRRRRKAAKRRRGRSVSLRDYARKRRFQETPEPDADKPGGRDGRHRPIFVVQLHHARARHYDFRLEADGTLKSWAVPKGPSLRAGEKRLAVEVEDHPLSYATFEGDIPEGNYGAGHVDVFDHGTWASEGDPLEAIAAGKLDFVLHGEKLNGAWKLVRTNLRGKQKQWLLIKREDGFAADLEADDLVGKAAVAGHARRRRRRHARGRKPPKQSSKWTQRALAIEGARKRDYPAGFAPQLASSRETAPEGEGWLHEIKWDGYRMMADLVAGTVKLRSRGELDWTATFPEIARAVEALPVDDAAAGWRTGGDRCARTQRFQRPPARHRRHFETTAALRRVRHARHRRRGPERGAVAATEIAAQAAAGQTAWRGGLQRARHRPRRRGVRGQQAERAGRHRQQTDRLGVQRLALAGLGQGQARGHGRVRHRRLHRAQGRAHRLRFAAHGQAGTGRFPLRRPGGDRFRRRHAKDAWKQGWPA